MADPQVSPRYGALTPQTPPEIPRLLSQPEQVHQHQNIRVFDYSPSRLESLRSAGRRSNRTLIPKNCAYGAAAHVFPEGRPKRIENCLRLVFRMFRSKRSRINDDRDTKLVKKQGRYSQIDFKAPVLTSRLNSGPLCKRLSSTGGFY
jgi:hypothetical protein